MFDTGHEPTITKPVLELANLVLESAGLALESSDSIGGSSANPLKIGVWVRALILNIFRYRMQRTDKPWC